MKEEEGREKWMCYVVAITALNVSRAERTEFVARWYESHIEPKFSASTDTPP